MLTLLLPLLPLVLLAPTDVDAATRARIEARCSTYLSELHAKGSFPGASAALVLPDGSVVAVAVGVADADDPDAVKLRPSDRMLSGSIGKTYVSACALRLATAGELDLDAKAASFFTGEDDAWFARLPNAADFTVRQLLRHESGLPRYVFVPAFLEIVASEPDRVWQPRELLAYVEGAEPLFAAGEGWSYADTSYIVVGMILERVSGERFYDLARELLLEPLGLRDTIPSDRRELPGVVQGHVVDGRQLGLPERTIEGGQFVFNPQFEWCGGGFANTPADLARWAHALYRGRAFAAEYLPLLTDAVPAPMLGPRTLYGLGVMVRESELGTWLGHDGFMPGYLSTMGCFPDHEIAAALQLNTDSSRALPERKDVVLVDLVKIARDELAR